MPWPIGVVVFGAIALALNFAYQVAHKPTELVGLFDEHFRKTPRETWQSYGDLFREKATSIMTPDLLAALAQMESQGNPIVRTYWRWRWTTDASKIFAPASSAVGMFQITQSTFEEAKRYCVRDGRVFVDHGLERECYGNFVYSRMIPAHAIEMTSARLHHFVEQITQRGARPRSLGADHRDKQTLATIIHLCGVGKGARLARSGFRLRQLGRCGDHDPVAYVTRVRQLQERFRAIDKRAGRREQDLVTLNSAD